MRESHLALTNGSRPIGARRPAAVRDARSDGHVPRVVEGGNSEPFAQGSELPESPVLKDWRVLSGQVVTLNFASWKQLGGWLRQVEGLRRVV